MWATLLSVSAHLSLQQHAQTSAETTSGPDDAESDELCHRVTRCSGFLRLSHSQLLRPLFPWKKNTRDVTNWFVHPAQKKKCWLMCWDVWNQAAVRLDEVDIKYVVFFLKKHISRTGCWETVQQEGTIICGSQTENGPVSARQIDTGWNNRRNSCHSRKDVWHVENKHLW